MPWMVIVPQAAYAEDYVLGLLESVDFCSVEYWENTSGRWRNVFRLLLHAVIIVIMQSHWKPKAGEVPDLILETPLLQLKQTFLLIN